MDQKMYQKLAVDRHFWDPDLHLLNYTQLLADRAYFRKALESAQAADDALYEAERDAAWEIWGEDVDKLGKRLSDVERELLRRFIAG